MGSKAQQAKHFFGSATAGGIIAFTPSLTLRKPYENDFFDFWVQSGTFSSGFINPTDQIVYELNRAIDRIENIETTALLIIKHIPVLMLRHKRRPALPSALSVKLKAYPLDRREIDLPLGDDQLDVDQVVCASVLLRLAARPVQLLRKLMFERDQRDGRGCGKPRASKTSTTSAGGGTQSQDSVAPASLCEISRSTRHHGLLRYFSPISTGCMT